MQKDSLDSGWNDVKKYFSLFPNVSCKNDHFSPKIKLCIH